MTARIPTASPPISNSSSTSTSTSPSISKSTSTATYISTSNSRLIVIIVRSVTLPGAEKGVEYYLVPDFTKINGKVILDALTQVFFSLGIGWGMMITYGSYLPKNQNIVSSSLWVGAMDTSVALLAGFMVFPAVFAFNGSVSQGPTLVFTVLANIFQVMPFGHIAGALFFLLLFFAADRKSVV